jgi:hypothetical protein
VEGGAFTRNFIPLRERTVWVEPEKAPSQLHHGAAHPRVASSREAFLAPTIAALVWRSG